MYQLISRVPSCQRRLRLRYKLTLTHGGRQLTEDGDVDNFPDWTSLIGPPENSSD